MVVLTLLMMATLSYSRFNVVNAGKTPNVVLMLAQRFDLTVSGYTLTPAGLGHRGQARSPSVIYPWTLWTLRALYSPPWTFPIQWEYVFQKGGSMNIGFRGLMDFHYIFHLAVSRPIR